MRISLYILGLVFLLSSCELDAFMFNPDADITEYKLDDYEGESEIELGSQYDIDDSLVTLFTLAPNDDRENELHVVYVGDIDRIAVDTVIIYCHGNAGNLDYYWDRCKLLANVGGKNRFGVMMMDYQGYGLSKGTASEENLINDVRDCLAWLKEHGLSDDRLISYGFSLGATPSTYHASINSIMNPAWHILETPFAGTEVIIQDASKLAMPSEFVVTAKHDVAQMIKSVYQPFLWIHGINDSYLAIDTHGEVVFKNYTGQRGVPVRVEGGEHGDVPYVMGFEEYLQTVENFVFNN